MQAVIYEGHLRNPNKPEDVALHKEGAVLNNLRAVGTVPLLDTDRTLAMLERALPIRVVRTLPWSSR